MNVEHVVQIAATLLSFANSGGEVGCSLCIELSASKPTNTTIPANSYVERTEHCRSVPSCLGGGSEKNLLSSTSVRSIANEISDSGFWTGARLEKKSMTKSPAFKTQKLKVEGFKIKEIQNNKQQQEVFEFNFSVKRQLL